MTSFDPLRTLELPAILRSMKEDVLRLAVGCATLMLFCSSVVWGRAAEERWIATSTAAMAITGDIQLSPTRLRTERADFPLKVVADLPSFEGFLGFIPARVLAVTTPTSPPLLNGNRLCSKPVRWIVVARTKDDGLELDAFTGKRMPTSVKTDQSCGGLFYSKP
jgi:hypothetical protein